MQNLTIKRIEQIDALRGFALFGIIMTHMFEGYLASMTRLNMWDLIFYIL